MKLRVISTDQHVLTMRTRMPFKYGIATLTALPHLIVRAQVEIDGRVQAGLAADGLPPKWFTKDPKTHFRDDLKDMMQVIQAACNHAIAPAPAGSVFGWWRELYAAQGQWAEGKYPPLLWNFGVSLVERAVIDAFCRATNQTFAAAVRSGALGIRLGDLHAELSSASPSDLLPPAPLEWITVRHTVGLSDPLTDQDIPPSEAANDGLPQSLAAAIAAYGVTHFKIKLSGDPGKDRDRLARLASILDARCPSYAFTLDGNENFHTLPPFRDLWQSLTSDTSLARFLSRLIFVEQPLHRDVALSAEVKRALLNWSDRPPIIIDESDATLASAPQALESGYIGTSHKNCKGIFKGIGNAALIAQRRRSNPRLILSGEDLANVGPIALFQDLAVLATLGVTHAERNGHHYFRGLAAFPPPIQDQMLSAHSDLYHRHPNGFATLRIEAGNLSVQSINRAPFGTTPEIDPTLLMPLDRWDSASLD